jgi:chromosomal replication initiation ATPase DnaA
MVTDCLRLSERIYKLPKGATSIRKRFRSVSHARQNAMLLAREEGNTLTHIAKVMNFDHTTVIHGIKKATERRDLARKRSTPNAYTVVANAE